MKNKKVYIGISIVTVLVICIVASIFYIKANNKDVKYADFSKDISNEDTKEANRICNDCSHDDGHSNDCTCRSVAAEFKRLVVAGG